MKKLLYYGDYNAIEARVAAWLAGESHVLETFKKGEDVYVHAYSRSFNIDKSLVTPAQRQIGKVQIIALGYQGSSGAFKKMAEGYGVSLTDREIETIVERWRSSHPNIVNFWWELERKALDAVRYPGDEFYAGGVSPGIGVRYKKQGSFLFCKLPSGRILTYPYSSIQKVTFTTKKGKTVTKDALKYKAVDSMTRKFEDQSAYGGLLFENVVQAIARDLLAHALINLEADNFPVVLHCHDEAVCEGTPSNDESEMKRIMEVLPEWAKGLPIVATVHKSKRYLK